jgi:hypothetical protein
MYYALLRFGRHWKFSVKRARPVKLGRKIVARAEAELPANVPAAQQQILSARDWIRMSAPSLEQIEKQASEADH